MGRLPARPPGRGGCTAWSCQGKDLREFFPDIVAGAGAQIPAACVVDGEAMVWVNDRLSFEALQHRFAKRSLTAQVREHPASYAAFDVFAVAGHDARARQLPDRRQLLEELAKAWTARLNLSSATTKRWRRWSGSAVSRPPVSKGPS
jgi:ATP-dependent DNA ligase